MTTVNRGHQDSDGVEALIVHAARSVQSLAPAVSRIAEVEAHLNAAARAEARGHFTAGEDQDLKHRFSLYLTARAGLHETIRDLRPFATLDERGVEEEQRLRAFLVAYTATCLLVRAGRFIVAETKDRPVVRAKLNEAAPSFGVPRKQLTAIYASLTDPRNSFALYTASRYADDHREQLCSLIDDPILRPVVELFKENESAMDIRKREYARARLSYRLHSWHRRRRSALQKTMFVLFEASGRVIADMRNPFHHKRVTPEILESICSLLEPGDVMITRHDDAMSNLFLPGFWPHASLHVGPASGRPFPETTAQPGAPANWVEPLRVLEARKDGVMLRSLDDTLQVDSVAVIRPELSQVEIGRAVERALSHEGKLYDFEFDFTRSDRLVCTEVVYRAYDGVGPMAFQLKRRAGRLTLSAEDLLDLAISGNGFHPVAVFGVPGHGDRLVTGSDVKSVLEKSYRKDSAT